MRTPNVNRAATAVAISLSFATALGLGACGGEDEPAGPSSFRPSYEPVAGARPGGELRVIAAGDIDSLDPGAAQNQFSFMLAFATQRSPVVTANDEAEEIEPDLATAVPVVRRNEGRIEFELKPDIRFSPPVSRTVEPGDIKYALERTLLPGVANGLVESYLGKLEGFGRARRLAIAEPRSAPEISGIVAGPGDHLRFEFRGPVPPLALEALSLPMASPVPPEYARPFDAEVPSAYGRHAVGTGPYMVRNDESGELTGYRPGRSTELVRNPEWNPDTDFRPAFLDRITVENGYSNTTAASRNILSGDSMVNGDFSPEPLVLEEAATDFPDQLTMVPAGAILYAALNTKVAPLDDADVRRAVVAAADRYAMRLARGGEFIGPLATHFIPPGIPGFEQAGGFDGPGYDFLSEPSGSPEIAREYMKKAGYPSGEYEGEADLTMVTDTTTVGRNTGEIVGQAFAELGIPVTVRSVPQDVMYGKYCNKPAAGVAICPNVGWVKQFSDAQTVLDATFNGNAIRSANNSNWPQLDDPAINRRIESAKEIFDPAERAEAWARIDRLITRQAPAIPIVWSEVASITSADVENVIDRSIASPELPMMSIAAGGD